MRFVKLPEGAAEGSSFQLYSFDPSLGVSSNRTINKAARSQIIKNLIQTNTLADLFANRAEEAREILLEAKNDGDL